MVALSRAPAAQVILTVGPRRLTLTTPGDAHSFEVPFDAAAFDPEAQLTAVEVHGQALWNATFAGTLGPLLDVSVRSDEEPVTLRVVPAADLQPALHWIAWETLFDASRRDFLALTSGWSIVRGPDPFQRFRELRAGPVGTLVVDAAAAPREEELEAILAEVGLDRPLTVERGPDAESLLALLRGSPAQIVHLLVEGRGEGLTVPGEHPDRGEFVAGTAVAKALQANPAVGLVVLSGGATAVVAEMIARTAEVAVLAHRTAVRDDHAARLTEVFYRSLFDGIPADVALTEARRALDRRFPGERAWTSAVLVTGWPPPVVPTATDEDPDADRDATTAEALTRLLHRTNLERIVELLAVADWEPLRQQRDQAERGLRPNGQP